MLNVLMFLPRLFRYFGMFQSAMGFIRPFWPQLTRVWNRMGSKAPQMA